MPLIGDIFEGGVVGHQIPFEARAEGFAEAGRPVDVESVGGFGDKDLTLHSSFVIEDGGTASGSLGQIGQVIGGLSVEVAEAVGTGQPPFGAGREVDSRGTLQGRGWWV